MKLTKEIIKDLEQALVHQQQSYEELKSTKMKLAETEAAAKLIEISKGNVSGFIFVINLFDLGGCDKLIKKGHKVENLIEFPGH